MGLRPIPRPLFPQTHYSYVLGALLLCGKGEGSEWKKKGGRERALLPMKRAWGMERKGKEGKGKGREEGKGGDPEGLVDSWHPMFQIPKIPCCVYPACI